MRKLGLYVLFFVLYGVILTIAKYISILFDYETRARILRFRTTMIIWSFALMMSVYIWIALSPLFDSDISSRTETNLYNFEAIYKKWESLKFNEKVWRTILLAILFLGNCSYTTFSFFLSSDPYKVAIVFFISFALIVLLFTGLVLMKLFTLLGTLSGCLSERTAQKYKRLRHVCVLIFAVFITCVGYYNSLSLPELKEVKIPVKDLPKKLNGLSITLIPDIHLGPTVGRTRLERVVNIVNYLQSGKVYSCHST